MTENLPTARLGETKGNGLITPRFARFVFTGSNGDAQPLREALATRCRLAFRGPVLRNDGTLEINQMDVRILVIEEREEGGATRFVCALTPARKGRSWLARL